MKIRIVSLLIVPVLLLTANATAQQKNMMQDQQPQQMREMMQDSTMRSMMMRHMAQNPQMRRQMMRHMMNAMKADSTISMGTMRQMMQNNPDMKKRMESHMHMMQSMMRGAEMKMDSTRMNHYKRMHNFHMLCMQMMMEDLGPESSN